MQIVIQLFSHCNISIRIFYFLLPEDPVFKNPGQSARLEKKLLPNEIEPIKALCGKSFYPSRALCPEVLKTGSSGTFS
jgi:hypothetical protein